MLSYLRKLICKSTTGLPVVLKVPLSKPEILELVEENNWTLLSISDIDKLIKNKKLTRPDVDTFVWVSDTSTYDLSEIDSKYHVELGVIYNLYTSERYDIQIGDKNKCIVIKD